jgi:hypothetical protein
VAQVRRTHRRRALLSSRGCVTAVSKQVHCSHKRAELLSSTEQPPNVWLRGASKYAVLQTSGWSGVLERPAHAVLRSCVQCQASQPVWLSPLEMKLRLFAQRTCNQQTKFPYPIFLPTKFC